MARVDDKLATSHRREINHYREIEILGFISAGVIVHTEAGPIWRNRSWVGRTQWCPDRRQCSLIK